MNMMTGNNTFDKAILKRSKDDQSFKLIYQKQPVFTEHVNSVSTMSSVLLNI